MSSSGTSSTSKSTGKSFSDTFKAGVKKVTDSVENTFSSGMDRANSAVTNTVGAHTGTWEKKFAEERRMDARNRPEQKTSTLADPIDTMPEIDNGTTDKEIAGEAYDQSKRKTRKTRSLQNQTTLTSPLGSGAIKTAAPKLGG